MTQKGFAPILLIILIGALSVSGYFIYKNKTPPKLSQNNATSLPSVNPTTLPSTGNGWKKYTNSKLGFTVNYPSNGFVRVPCENEEEFFYLTPGNHPEPTSPQNCARDSRFNIEIVANEFPPDLDSRYKFVFKKLSVGGVEAFHYTFEPKAPLDGPGEEWYEVIYFQNNGLFYNAYNRNKENSPVFLEILKSFKFENSLLSKEMEGWKNFQTPDKKISFSFPTDWQIINQATSSEGWGKPITVAHIKKGDSTVALGEASFMNECMEQVVKYTVLVSGNLFHKTHFKGKYLGGYEACSTPEIANQREIWLQPISKESDPYNYVHGLMIGYKSSDSKEAEMVFNKILTTLKYTQ
jgi:hypothetical protein